MFLYIALKFIGLQWDGSGDLKEAEKQQASTSLNQVTELGIQSSSPRLTLQTGDACTGAPGEPLHGVLVSDIYAITQSHLASSACAQCVVLSRSELLVLHHFHWCYVKRRHFRPRKCTFMKTSNIRSWMSGLQSLPQRRPPSEGFKKDDSVWVEQDSF